MGSPVVGITNSPNVGEKRKVFLPGGHMGPPLRQRVRMAEMIRRILSFECPILERNREYSTEMLKNLFMHGVGISS